MENSLYIGLSRQLALQETMQTIANNIANVSTPGYRAQNMLFEEYLEKQSGDFDKISFVSNRGQYMSTEEGSMAQTGNPLDVALAGSGYMVVNAPDGSTAYTRAGNFQIDSNGVLMTSAGDEVSSGGGGTITIPAGSTEIKIDEKGMISNQDGQIGQLQIVEFQNQQTLNPIGHNLYASSKPPVPAANTRVKQGMIEGSNVQAVLEMTRMIDTLRSFQSLQQIMQGENERLRGVIQKLTKS